MYFVSELNYTERQINNVLRSSCELSSVKMQKSIAISVYVHNSEEYYFYYIFIKKGLKIIIINVIITISQKLPF